MTEIPHGGVLCFKCKWRNTGRVDECRSCGERLLSVRPLVGPDLSAWVEWQMRQRTELGIGTDVAHLKSLRQWAAQGKAREFSATLDSVEVTTSEAITYVRDSADPVLVVPKSVCPSCALEYTESTKFCSECGTATEPPEAALQLAQLAQVLDRLSARVHHLEEEDRSVSTQSGFNWFRVPNDEKWKVAWGVFGRTILIHIALWMALIVFALALGLIGALAR